MFGSLASAQPDPNVLLDVASSVDEVTTHTHADDSDATERIEQASAREVSEELPSEEVVSSEDTVETGVEAPEADALAADDSVQERESPGADVLAADDGVQEHEAAADEGPEPLVDIEKTVKLEEVSPRQPQRTASESFQLAEPMNDVALVVGWNAPSGWGGRYLRRIDDTQISVGIGLAPLTLWGIKLSLVVRRAAERRSGFFQQLSVGFSTGAESYEAVVMDENGAQTAVLRKTPGRTVDLVLGYRWGVFSNSYAELFTGWSFNFQGTFLQRTTDNLVPLPEQTRSELVIQTPGGVILGLTFGWLF